VSSRTRVTPRAFRISAGKSEVAMVGFESRRSLASTGPGLRLQFVSLQLGHEADAATLLLFVNQDAGAPLW